MNRPSAPSDFTIEVDGVGTFVFARRTRRDNFRISAEYHRLTEGVDVSGTDFALDAEAQATLSTLLVDGPIAFSKYLELDSPDPLDADVSLKIVRVFMALRKKELSFRAGPDKASEGSGSADGVGDGVLVPAPIQPAAN